MNQEKMLPNAISVILSRKSVRSFSGRSIEKEKIDTILKAAMAAPTAVNMQPWAFIVVTDREILDKLCSGLPYAKMLDKAGAAIVVCGIPQKAFGERVEYAVIDGTCASENILLAAEALGLGALWTAAYPYSDRIGLVRKTLNIPDDIIPLNVIPIGYPAGTHNPIDKFKKENIHWEKW
ncbi:MAG: nitroreductase family protein [Smithellaceae bacterium]